MNKLATLFAAALFAVCAHADQKGIVITNVTLEADAVRVYWATDLEPPFRAAVHVPKSFWSTRSTPVAFVDTYAHEARISLDISPATVFVQVYKTNDESICPPSTRHMIKTEWNNYLQREQNEPMTTVSDVTLPPQLNSGSRIYWKNGTSVSTDVITPGTSVAFIPTLDTNVSFRVTSTIMRYNDPNEEPEEITVTTNCVIKREFDSGPGIRVTVRTDSVDARVEASEAYSARENMSQAVLIRRGSISLAENAYYWREVWNWMISPTMTSCTNQTPYVAYELKLKGDAPNPNPKDNYQISCTKYVKRDYDRLNQERGKVAVGLSHIWNVDYIHAGQRGVTGIVKVIVSPNSLNVWPGYTKPVDFMNHAYLRYRWRHLGIYRTDRYPKETQWESILMITNGTPNTLTAIKGIDVPDVPCDLEYYYEGINQSPYYGYVDYTGLDIGTPGYTEAPPVVINSRLYRMESEEVLPSFGKDWYMRARKYRSSIHALRLSYGG